MKTKHELLKRYQPEDEKWETIMNELHLKKQDLSSASRFYRMMQKVDESMNELEDAPHT
jgi:hypothetical protein